MNPLLSRRGILSVAAISTLPSDVHGQNVAQAAPQRSGTVDPAHGMVSIRQFGAIGDGNFHPLLSRFETMAAARSVYSSAETPGDSLDGAAIQAAIDVAAKFGADLQARWSVHIPAGRYRLSRPIRLPNNVALVGDGIGISIIDNQNTPLDAPLIVNADPAVASMSISGLSLHGGTHGVKIDVHNYVDGYEFDHVSFQMQSDKNFECNRLLQIGSFINCVFAKSPYGLYVSDWTTNIANFYNCLFENHARESLHLNGAECVSFFGGRFEAGGDPDAKEATIFLANAASVNFHGIYFEGTHPVLLRERRSRNGITFDGCHFTGAAHSGSPGSYQFESDGIVHFGTNDWGTTSAGPARMGIYGDNAGLIGPGRRYLLRTPLAWNIVSEHVPVLAGQARKVLRVKRVEDAGAPDALASLTGTLEVTHLGRRADGTPRVLSGVYRVIVTSPGKSQTLTIELSPSGSGTSPGSVQLQRVSGIAADEAIIGARAGDGLEGVLQWSFVARCASTDTRVRLDADFE